MSAVLLESLNAWWPEAILSLGGLLTILLGAWARAGRSRRTPAMAAAWLTLLASGALLFAAPAPAGTGLFFGLIVTDPFSLVIRWVAWGAVALTLLLVQASEEFTDDTRGEAAGLILLIGVGLMLMAEANHLLMAYVAMELVSLSSYVLVGFLNEPRSSEASLKYFLFGALASGLMLFGMSLLFGITGALSFPELRQATAGLAGPLQTALLMTVSLLFAGLAFKISMVPFHMWTPDAYEGAPIPIAALLSVGPKAAGFALLVRLMEALGVVWPTVEPLILWLTVLTMTLGNLVALAQTNVKRLLAYSTIGQVGYLLIGFAVKSPWSLPGLLLYLVAYLFMNMGAFACVAAVVRETRNESVEAFRGLARRAPGLALLFAVFLLSLAGLPPLLGFFGKALLFGAALDAHRPWLAIAGIVNSAIALYYYVNLLRLMYLHEPEAATPLRPAVGIRVALAVCGAGTILLGLFPQPLLAWLASSAVVNLL